MRISLIFIIRDIKLYASKPEYNVSSFTGFSSRRKWDSNYHCKSYMGLKIKSSRQVFRRVGWNHLHPDFNLSRINFSDQYFYINSCLLNQLNVNRFDCRALPCVFGTNPKTTKTIQVAIIRKFHRLMEYVKASIRPLFLFSVKFCCHACRLPSNV